MKFSCDNCGTRYQVSDDKVRGKLARLRCRRCRELVTVDGTILDESPSGGVEGGGEFEPAERESPAQRSTPTKDDTGRGGEDRGSAEPSISPSLVKARDEAPSPRSDGSPLAGPKSPQSPPRLEGGWHAVMGRDQVGPMDALDLMDAIRAGRLTGRTYVWRADMGQWKPAGEVEAIAPLLAMGGGAVPRPSPPPAPAPSDEQREAATEVVAPEPEQSSSEAEKPAAPGPEERRVDPVPAASEGSKIPVASASRAQSLETDDSELDEAGQEDDLQSLFAQASRDAEEQGLGFEGEDTAPRPEPVSAAGLDDFFEEGGDGDQALDPFAAALAEELATSASADPFSRFSDAEDPKESPIETTQMFILASGVKKQRSPLRIAAFVAGMAGLVLAMGFVVTRVGGFQLGDLFVGSERRQAQAWESTGKESDLRDRLLGIKKEEAQTRADRGSGRETPSRIEEAAAERRIREELEAERGAVDSERKEMLGDLYETKDRGAIAVRQRRDRVDQGPVASAESPIDPEVIHRRIADTQPAFESCLLQEMRRNPSFRAGRAELVLTVVPSGVVRQARLSDRMLDRSDLGRCITLAARRIMLPGFAGEDPVDIVIPLLLSSAS